MISKKFIRPTLVKDKMNLKKNVSLKKVTKLLKLIRKLGELFVYNN